MSRWVLGAELTVGGPLMDPICGSVAELGSLDSRDMLRIRGRVKPRLQRWSPVRDLQLDSLQLLPVVRLQASPRPTRP